MHNLDLSISDISKIEGKASCQIKIRKGQVEDVAFSISEYKRFYSQAIRGKDIVALPQLTARICGTCSNAHLICSIKAVENGLGLTPSQQTILLRKLLNYGLIIRDHALHLYVFALPDLFNKDSILDFDEKDQLQYKLLVDCFSVKACGNQLSKIVGGRAVHAPFLTVGGFTKLPKGEELKNFLPELENIRAKVIDLIKIFKKSDFYLEAISNFFAAIIDSEYSFLYGDLITSSGEKEASEKYGNYLEQKIIPYSHASAYQFAGHKYMVGALSRLNLAKDKLHQRTKESLGSILDTFPSRNIFHNNLAQAIEILHAIDSAYDIIEKLKIVEEKPLSFQRKEGWGIGVIEAPRGVLYYQLEMDKQGKIVKGQIVVPTGQNQMSIEDSLRSFLEKNIKSLEGREQVEHEIEKIVRAYDPCMSCASHFLKVKWL